MCSRWGSFAPSSASGAAHLPVSAEEVETKEQMNFLKHESWDEVQAFLCGRPRPMEAYAHLVGRDAGAAQELLRAG